MSSGDSRRSALLVQLRREKVVQQTVPVAGQYRFWVKLYARDAQTRVLYAHYLIRQAVFRACPGGDGQAIRKRVFGDD